MFNESLILLIALWVMIQGATYATRYAARLAESFGLSTYTIGFIVVAVISIMPETFISLNAARAGVAELGLGVLFGSNVADLTLIIAITVLVAGRSLRVDSTILKHQAAYPFILLVPIILGIDGAYGRIEGTALILTGAIFYYLTFKNGASRKRTPINSSAALRAGVLLVASTAALLVGATVTVDTAVVLASGWGISPVLIGMFVIGIGTTMPELFFAIRSARAHDDSLALGDILGTVLADATIVVGLLALVAPFTFPVSLVYSTGAIMVLAAWLLFRWMRSGRMVSHLEAYLLILIWIAFALIEAIVNH